ncbi:DUF4159 domain-containing protein [Rhizobiaceae bacterium]|nr:DUF4159 domain-containing protein [Rhizobiaceae bacterium]
MTLLGFTFAAPWVLVGLLALPAIWYLLRLTPPRPIREMFPPTRILAELKPKEETPAHSPWWLTLLRLAMTAFVVLALSEPVWNAPDKTLAGSGPVLVVVDDGWTSGPDWDARRDAAERVIAEAEVAERPVALRLASDPAADMEPQLAAVAAERLQAARPHALQIDYSDIAGTIDASAFESAVWVAPSVQPEGADAMATALSAAAQSVVLSDEANAVAIVGAANDPAALTVLIERSGNAADGTVSIYDGQSRNLGTSSFAFEDESTEAVATFELPVELRNEVTRAAIDGVRNGGAVHLLDERFQRRRVGLIAGGNADRDQPLLSPLYYIDRALAPFAEVREAESGNVIEAVDGLIADKVSVVMLADIGTIPDAAQATLGEWIDGGGTLVRFAGPRLAGGTQDEDRRDALLPVLLRGGDRSLGGTLSWGTPQPLAPFEDTSPFAGLPVPDDVTVSRQVLAEPDAELVDKTWASLSDGTPLVTATRLGDGWIVLFHVTADAGWSNLPLSGVFVDMLRRVVAASQGTGSGENNGGEEAVLPPLRIIDGVGRLVAPGEDAEPLALVAGAAPEVSLRNPPGLYGTSDAYVASNLFESSPGLRPFNAVPSGASVARITADKPLAFGPWLLAAALLLLALDCLAVLWMAGALRRMGRGAFAAAAVLLAIAAVPPNSALAQDAAVDFERTFGTRLAYVRTGDRAVDDLSRKGLEGLTRFIASRTSLEPGPPVGIDLAEDELAFFPLLYWPVDAAAAMPEPAGMARLDAFMKQGGSVLFDTRDQLTGGFGGTSVSANTARLREMLSALDIPALEPVPQNHVLTRAFYLLDIFPGRYLDGPLWVEASATADDAEDRPARAGDGVSSILITANDMAGAWAVEADGRATMPIVPPDPLQRTYAYRTGTNIVMYTLTGNYKADQVHIPALLERLGQ